VRTDSLIRTPRAFFGNPGKALELAQLEGLIRRFVDNGEPAARLLSKIFEAKEQGRPPESPKISRAYLRKLVTAFKETPVASIALESAHHQSAEPLTNRRVEVLQLIVAECPIARLL